MAASTLSRSEAQALYDRIGRWQDTQSFYEAPAQEALLEHGRFAEAHTVLEIGCGTGRLAARLLRTRCPPGARYLGVDLSETMATAARERLAPFEPRATVVQTGGGFDLDPLVRRYLGPAGSGGVDCVLSTYVLDLLSESDIRAALDAAARMLRPSGRLCLAGLTRGSTLPTRLVSSAWAALQALAPRMVGGCRPVELRPLLNLERWAIEHCEVVSAWGVPSEVLVARRR